MPTPVVNTFVRIGAVLALAACTNADARAPETQRADAPASPTSYTATTTRSIDVSNSALAVQNDSLTKAADLGRVQGSASATVWVVEISDMQCPYCKEWHSNTYPKLRDEFIKTGKIRFAYINFPLSMHKNAMPASRAAMCASTQGKFWEMQDEIFNTQEKWESLADPSSFFEGIAKDVGVNTTSWKSCTSSKSIQSVIDADITRAKKQDVRSTPSFIVAGRLLEGAVPIEDLRKVINAALGEKK